MIIIKCYVDSALPKNLSALGKEPKSKLISVISKQIENAIIVNF